MNGDEMGDNAEQTPTTAFGHYSPQLPLLPFVDLRPEDRMTCVDLSSSPNQVNFGKYLLCQTISTADHFGGVAIEMSITDPDGASTMTLALFHYSDVENCVLGLNYDDILPPGSFLVVKNPCWTSTGESFMLQCYNPEEVELLSWKRVQVKFPDLEWKGPIKKMVYDDDEKRNFWGDFEDDKAAFEKLKRLGNKGFVGKRFTDAIRFYNMALDYCKENVEDEAMICSNKCAALLSLGCFNAALKCAESALEVDPSNEKYNYRKTKALIGLGKYEEAMSFLGGKFDQFPSLNKSKDCKTLLDVIKSLCSREKLGPTESQLLSIRKKTLENDANIPEFTGPLTISKIEGKGRGFVATEDISTSQLLLCVKAFGHHALSPNAPTAEQIVGKIANKLAFDPEMGPELYNLTAGTELGHLAPGDWEVGHVDMKRIRNIVKINAFGSNKATLKNGEASEFTGLWILPSFFNHSCSEHNCIWFICGEWMMVTAIAEIKKGDELTITYISSISSFKDRTSSFNKFGFICGCSLCRLDASEPISISNERERILKNLGELSSDCGRWELKRALEEVDKLVSLRKHNIPLNFPLLSPQILRLHTILMNKRRLGDSISLLSQMHDVAAASVCLSDFGEPLMIKLLTSYTHRGDKELVKVWSGNLKALAMKLYGSLEFSGIPLKLFELIDLSE